MASGVPTDVAGYLAQLGVYRQHDKDRDGLVTEIVQRYSTTLQSLESKCKAYEDEVEARRYYQGETKEAKRKLTDLEHALEANSFVYAIIDGDGAIFCEDLIAQGKKGGEIATHRLLTNVNEYLNRIHHDTNVESWHIVGPCHHKGYLVELKPYQLDRRTADKLTLLETTPVPVEFSELGFRQVAFRDVFRSQPLPAGRSRSSLLIPPPSAARNATSNGTPSRDTAARNSVVKSPSELSKDLRLVDTKSSRKPSSSYENRFGCKFLHTIDVTATEKVSDDGSREKLGVF